MTKLSEHHTALADSEELSVKVHFDPTSHSTHSETKQTPQTRQQLEGTPEKINLPSEIKKNPDSSNRPEAKSQYDNPQFVFDAQCKVNQEIVGKWLVLAGKGDKEGQYMVGLYHQNGWLIKKSMKKAAQLYLASAEQGYTPARIKLA